MCAQRTHSQPAHPHSLIRVLARRSVGSQGHNHSSYRQGRIGSDRMDVQDDLDTAVRTCQKIPAPMQLLDV